MFHLIYSFFPHLYIISTIGSDVITRLVMLPYKKVPVTTLFAKRVVTGTPINLSQCEPCLLHYNIINRKKGALYDNSKQIVQSSTFPPSLIAVISLLIMGITAAFSYGYVHNSLVVSGDSVTILRSIEVSSSLFPIRNP